MERHALCAACRQRLFARGASRAAVSSRECFICAGSLAALPRLIPSAIAQASSFEWFTFSVASSFPRGVLVRESEVATGLLPGEWTSIKNDVNAKLAKGIADATGKGNSQREADAAFTFDFCAGKASVRSTPIYLHGHYLKLSRSHCQSRWHCSECGGKGMRAQKGGAPAVAGRAEACHSCDDKASRAQKGTGVEQACHSCGSASGAGGKGSRAGKGKGSAHGGGGNADVCGSCGGSGMNYPSVEDELGAIFRPAFGASGCLLHASGREDVDVRCLGAGRPFVAELSSPRKRSADLRALEAAFSANANVRANGLRLVHKGFIDSVCNSHFDKEYEATVSADRALTATDAKKLSSLPAATLFQHTPKRVLSRRTDMLRARAIRSICAKPLPGGKLRLRILAEAGTYIKEFIHSDGGRTRPSVSSLLGCSAQCDELDVTAIRDYFLQTVKD